MSDKRIGLDNPVFVGRYRQFGRGSYMPYQPKNVATRIINDIQLSNHVDTDASQKEIVPEYIDVSEYEPVTVSATSITRSSVGSRAVRPPVKGVSKSTVIQRNIAKKPTTPKSQRSFFSTRRVVVSMVVIAVLTGLGTVAAGFRPERAVQAQTNRR